MSDLDAILGAIEAVRRDLRGDIDTTKKRMDERFDRSQVRFDTLEDSHAATNEYLRQLNGQVSRNVSDIATHAAKISEHQALIVAHAELHRDEANVNKGRKEQRQADVDRIRTLRDFWPLATGAILAGLGVGSFLWSLLG